MKKVIATAVVACLAGCAASDRSGQDKGVDMIITNGKFYGHPVAEAVAIDNGTITYIGSREGANQITGNDTQVIDVGGKLVLPGFIDNHSHLGEGGEVSCFPRDDLNLEQQAKELAKCARGVPSGTWIIGYGMTMDNVLGFGNVMNNPLATMDKIFPDNPVIIMEHSSHAMFVNSLALEAAGIDKNTPHPQGGKIMKDEDGELLGVLVDNAGDIVMELAVNAVDNKFDVFYEGILYGLGEAAKNGITTVGDGRTYWRRGMYDAWQSVQKNGDLTARVSLRPWIYPTVEQDEQLKFLEAVYQNDIRESLIVNQVKMYSDGVPENGTAKVIEPYTDTWFPESPNGINYIPQQQMESWLTQLMDIGYGAHIHAIGDKGVRETLNAIAVARLSGSHAKYHMTHVFMVDPADLTRFSELSVDVDIQVGEAQHSHEDRMHDYVPYIGEQRASELLYRPIKEIAASGANVTLSSDWSVYPMSPLNAISHTVAEGSWDIHAAIDAYTINAAKALGVDSITGSLDVGKSADLVVLKKDITQLPAVDIIDADVSMTFYQGELVYQQ